MTVYNKLDKSFGPIGTVAGITIFIVGVIVMYYMFSGIILVLIGAFVGFTATGTELDFENKKIRYTSNLFGLIKMGAWKAIEPDMKIGIKKTTKTWRAFSRSNRSVDITDSDYRLILYNAKKKQIAPVKKTKSYDLAKTELEMMCNKLGLHAAK